jgi:hypothetical protein
MTGLPNLYTTEQAARVLGVTGRRVRQLAIEYTVGTKLGDSKFARHIFREEDLRILEKRG